MPTTEYTVTQLRHFYNAPESLNFCQFCKDNGLHRANLAEIWKASGLDETNKHEISLDLAMQTLELQLDVEKKI